MTPEDADRRFAQIEGERDYYKQMVARRESEIEALRRGLSDVLDQIEGNVEVAVRDIINGLASANDIYDDCEMIKAMIRKALGGGR